MNDIKTKFTTSPLQVKVKVVALLLYFWSSISVI